MHAINVSGTENMLSLALELCIPRTVYVSTVAYYGDTGAEVQDESIADKHRIVPIMSRSKLKLMKSRFSINRRVCRLSRSVRRT